MKQQSSIFSIVYIIEDRLLNIEKNMISYKMLQLFVSSVKSEQKGCNRQKDDAHDVCQSENKNGSFFNFIIILQTLQLSFSQPMHRDTQVCRRIFLVAQLNLKILKKVYKKSYFHHYGLFFTLRYVGKLFIQNQSAVSLKGREPLFQLLDKMVMLSFWSNYKDNLNLSHDSTSTSLFPFAIVHK